MSMHEMIDVTCPVCNKNSNFRIWKSINTTLNPEMKEKVMNREAFTFTCPNCGEMTNVVYGTLYHQMEDHIMIHFADSDENEKEILEMLNRQGDSEIDNLMRGMMNDNYLIRIVRSQNSLREKIQIFDAGLDDRVIEIAKVFVWVMYRDKNPDSKEVELFYLRDGDENTLVILDGGQQVASAPITDEFYDSLFKEYNINKDDLRKSEPIIDFNWAWNAVGLGETEES